MKLFAGIVLFLLSFFLCMLMVGLSEFYPQRSDAVIFIGLAFAWCGPFLVLGVVLIAVASLSGSARPTPPLWALNLTRRNPWLFAIVGLVRDFLGGVAQCEVGDVADRADGLVGPVHVHPRAGADTSGTGGSNIHGM